MSGTDALHELYPFLHGAKQDADKLHLALLESVRQKAADSVDTKRRFFDANATAVVAVAHSAELATPKRISLPSILPLSTIPSEDNAG